MTNASQSKVLRASSSVTVAKEKRASGGEQRSHLVAYRGRTSEREGLKKQKLRQADPTKRTLRVEPRGWELASYGDASVSLHSNFGCISVPCKRIEPEGIIGGERGRGE